jgi:hypothetical protein
VNLITGSPEENNNWSKKEPSPTPLDIGVATESTKQQKPQNKIFNDMGELPDDGMDEIHFFAWKSRDQKRYDGSYHWKGMLRGERLGGHPKDETGKKNYWEPILDEISAGTHLSWHFLQFPI